MGVFSPDVVAFLSIGSAPIEKKRDSNRDVDDDDDRAIAESSPASLDKLENRTSARMWARVVSAFGRQQHSNASAYLCFYRFCSGPVCTPNGPNEMAKSLAAASKRVVHTEGC